MSHCRRLVRLLWHSCGHLYKNHWEQLSTLNLRSQYSLVVAHMHCIAKMYDLLDNKELSALSHTLQRTRCDEAVVKSKYCEEAALKGMLQVTQFGDGLDAAQQYASFKSGSWGGHATAPAHLMCKPYSQTC
ncbi:unnamed protein product [Gongylonema pulchrum]|uniref:BRO1 domain-containing protein n=1 Tax=Gongylonema pulchrum TaxID=637853 RepID=A0A183D652_9BILA|nr:unnamed protein product [Gongylonema pulchrum]